MNQYIKYALTVVVTAAAMVAYQYQGKPEQVELAQQAPTQVPEIKNEIAQVEQSIPQVKDAQLEKLTKKWGVEYRKAYEAELAELEAEYVKNYEAIYVTFYNPSSSVCEQVEVVGDAGDLIAKEVCRDEYKLPRHPYYSLDNEALETLVYSEPLAAQILAERIGAEDSDAALQLLLHAAAISGKYGPLKFAAYQTFRVYDPIREIDVGDIATHIALIDVALAMGANPNTTSALKIPEGVEIDPSYVDELAEAMKASIAQTQITVTGSSSLKELFDA